MSSDRLHLFPVRHHSPAAAHLATQAIDTLRPERVLIEGPSDFNEHIAELELDHQLPIAIYSWVVTAAGERRGAYYPFCEYSPEWQALRTGWRVGAQVAFIDVPWAELAATERSLHRYGDGSMRRSAYVDELCRRLEVEDFDAAWDRLFEIESIDLGTYQERCRELCGRMRQLGDVSEADRRRERFMAARVIEALEQTTGPVFVLVGGFHVPALVDAVVRGGGQDQPGKEEAATESLGDDDSPTRSESLGAGQGLALTPYSYQALDSLTGYDAGMPSPGFYHRVWESRQEGAEAWPSVLRTVIEALRQANHAVSAADVIAIEATARSLATLRGHDEPWRRDLYDAVLTALIKEPTARDGGHPALALVEHALRGGARGRLAAGTSLPAMMRELLRRLEELDLDPRAGERRLELDLFDDNARERSRCLHAVRLLDVDGFSLVTGPAVLGHDPASESDLKEIWRLAPDRDFEASAIAASAYGPTVREATAARLLELSGGVERDAEAAATLLVDAALSGLEHISGLLRGRLAELLVTDPDFDRMARAAAHLFYLYRYDPILRLKGSRGGAELLALATVQSLRRFEDLGRPENVPQAIEALLIVLQIYEHGGEVTDLEDHLNQESLDEALERVAADRNQAPGLRGAALGALWARGRAEADRLENSLSAFANPEEIGDFLTGLFATAREFAQRHPGLASRLDALICAFGEEELLVALPGLRLAFSRFSPREKEALVRTLLGSDVDVDAVVRPQAGIEEVLELRALEENLAALMTRYGLADFLQGETWPRKQEEPRR